MGDRRLGGPLTEATRTSCVGGPTYLSFQFY